MKSTNPHSVVIIDALRTPFVKSFGLFENETPLNLSCRVVSEILARNNVPGHFIDEVIWGTVISSLPHHNIARDIVAFSGLPFSIPGHTVSMACTSAFRAMQSGIDAIQAGRHNVVLTGGVESMSRVPLTFREDARQFFVKLNRLKTTGEKLALARRSFKLSMLFPTAPALAESITGLTMGDHAEIMAIKNNISRESQDLYTTQSHARASKAVTAGWINNEIVPVVSKANGNHMTVDCDDIVRPNLTMEDLKKLRPVFDKKFGTLTAGNSTALTDGASSILLANESFASQNKFPVLGRIVHSVTVAVDPNDQLLIGPAYAIPELLKQVALSESDIDVFELHEAFAAQLLSCTARLNIPAEKLNVDGGSLAYGHPLAASGGRLIARGLRIAKRLNVKRVVVSACAAGGIATAMLLETI
jgi:acetyl-CoA acyltransferase